MTREELEDHVRRFADRYYTRMALAVGTIRKTATSDKEVEQLQGWQSIAQATAVDIAIGPNPVTNLMDMMVLTSLEKNGYQGLLETGGVRRRARSDITAGIHPC